MTGRPRRWCATVATLSFAVLTTAGCAGPGAGVDPGAEPLVRGVVDRVAARADSWSVLVLPGPGSREACGIAATVDRDTEILVRDARGRLDAAPPSRLRPGDAVAVYVSGPVAESCPVQGRADRIVIDP